MRRHKISLEFSHYIFLKDDGNVVTWGICYDEAFADNVWSIPKSIEVGLSKVVSRAVSDIIGYALDE